MAEYQPGVCNIGTAERDRRRYLGYAGFLLAAVFVVAVPVAGLDAVWLLASAAPLYGGVIGLLQARSGFCAGFGMAATYDVSETGTERREVQDAAARRADRIRALRMQVWAGVLAAALAGVVYLIGAPLVA